MLRIFVGNLPVASSLEKASNSQVNRPRRRNRIRTISSHPAQPHCLPAPPGMPPSKSPPLLPLSAIPFPQIF